MVAIKKQLVSANVINKRSYGYGNAKKYICIHETDNWGKGAGAQSHANLQSQLNPREASWHYQVDDKQVIQSFPHSVRCWAGGDGKTGAGNNQSIHIEICVNPDSDFKKAVQNAAELTKKIMRDENIPASRVVQHNKWKGKNCPRYLRAGNKGITWGGFIAMVQGAEYHAPKESPKSTAPKPAPAKQKANLAEDGKWGKATTRAVQKALGTPVDGVISNQPRNSVTQSFYGGTVSFGSGGSPMVRALQKKVGAKVDGKLGPETVRKLQKYLGTPVDGVISQPSSTVVKALQRRLNAGGF